MTAIVIVANNTILRGSNSEFNFRNDIREQWYKKKEVNCVTCNNIDRTYICICNSHSRRELYYTISCLSFYRVTYLVWVWVVVCGFIDRFFILLSDIHSTTAWSTDSMRLKILYRRESLNRNLCVTRRLFRSTARYSQPECLEISVFLDSSLVRNMKQDLSYRRMSACVHHTSAFVKFKANERTIEGISLVDQKSTYLRVSKCMDN